MKHLQFMKHMVLGISAFSLFASYPVAEAAIHIPFPALSNTTTAVEPIQYVGPMLYTPEKQEVTLPITMVFDPIVSETAYDKKYVQNGTSIMSPSWFELTTTGLKASSKLSHDYVNGYKEKGYRVWPLITNQFDPDMTSKILANESMWERYKQGLINYATEYGYDGYNFDFENIHYKDKAQLTKFVDFLAKGLRTYNLHTSIDVTGYSNSENWSLVYDRKAYADAVDYVVLMAYDETWASSNIAGPVASYPWVRKHTEQMLSEVPASKLVLGIPFYMREWSVPVKGSWEGKAKSKTLAMSKALDLEREYRDVMRWDERLKGNYLTLTKKNDVYGKYDEKKPYEGILTKIWFEDPQSLSYKVGLVKELQLAGVAAWRKGFEASDVWPVLSFALDGTNTNSTEKEKAISDKKDHKKEVKKQEKKKDKKKKSKHTDTSEVTKISKDGKEIVLKFKKPHKHSDETDVVKVTKEKKSLPKD
ncbi:glycosyl hydrolase family 18 protein [Veillonella sp. 3627]|uniref:glycosyl hydrolase family 18 protein n=1 Tax=Veillonella sp. 3627 TaxID=2490953 RepID=UPI000F8D6A98|nr:glycosyl hydrolase family 18 protein [Veillonella sp. 3627]